MMMRFGMAPALTGIALLVCGPVLVSRAVRPASPKSADAPSGLGGVGLSGTGVTASLPDPKHPGKLLWKIWAKSASGNLVARRATVHGITALMFQAGRRAAKMTAPQADYDEGEKTLVASGGVSYQSLTQEGLSMHAATVVYHADTGTGVARGGVVVRNNKNGATASLPVAYFDAGLKVVQSYPLHGGH